MAEKGKARRRAGRPPKRDGPTFDEQMVDSLLVHGEDKPSGGVQYPSYREVAQRCGVSTSTIADFAKRRNCLSRRGRAQDKKRERYDARIAELRADRMAMRDEDIVRIAERFMFEFESSLAQQAVRTDSVADFATMSKVRDSALGRTQVATEAGAGPSLEELERMHKQLLEQIRESEGPLSGRITSAPSAPTEGGQDGQH